MKPTITTPNTLHLYLWAEEGDAIILPSYRDCAGALHPLNGWFRGASWPALAGALEVTRDMRATHVLVISNVPEVVEALAPRLQLNLNIVCDPPTAHWQAVATLALRYPGRCNALHAASMPKTEAAWQQHYR
jgi:hypothetical protein